MPYQANKPLANDQLSQSQQDINGNFQVLGSIGGNGANNSAGINPGPGGAGFNYVYLPVNGNNPPLGSVFGTSNAIYSYVNPTSGRRSIYINQDTLGGPQQIAASASILGTATPIGNSAGWTYLPSGILMKWGFTAADTLAEGTQQVFFNTGPAFQNVPFNIQATVGKPAADGVLLNAVLAVNNETAANFQLEVRRIVAANPVQLADLVVYWFAIGR